MKHHKNKQASIHQVNERLNEIEKKIAAGAQAKLFYSLIYPAIRIVLLAVEWLYNR